MEFRNAQFNAAGTIDLEALHSVFGWIPMTASASDEATVELFTEAQAVALAYVPPDPIEPSPLTASDLLAALAARRYAAEEAGTTFNGFPLATDRTTQAKITAAYVKATGDPTYTIAPWKFAPGVFAPLDAATIIAAANVIEAHVQACFANEAALSARILAAATPEELAAIDLDAGWP